MDALILAGAIVALSGVFLVALAVVSALDRIPAIHELIERQMPEHGWWT